MLTQTKKKANISLTALLSQYTGLKQQLALPSWSHRSRTRLPNIDLQLFHALIWRYMERKAYHFWAGTSIRPSPVKSIAYPCIFSLSSGPWLNTSLIYVTVLWFCHICVLLLTIHFIFLATILKLNIFILKNRFHIIS